MDNVNFQQIISTKKRNYLWFPVFFLVFRPFPVFADNKNIEFGNIYFSVSPRILENGTLNDIILGYRYTEKYSGELHFRFSNEAKNEEFDIEGVQDSLNTSSGKNFEFFLLPFERVFIKNYTSELKAGIGLYYNFNRLHEKGYFNMPSLESLGRERVNSYVNDFSMHTFGFLLDAGITGRTENFEITGNAGIVPLFWFFSKQKTGMIPLLDPHYAEYSQNNFGSPYLYADINFLFIKHFSFGFLYDFSRLEYQVIDFDSNLNWYNPSRTVLSNVLKLEVSLLIPIMYSNSAKIGFGYSWESIQLDTNRPIWNKQYYFVVTTNINEGRKI